ncbi:polyamine-modulated factor 1 isoform X3 [Chionomys nivalis]|uniref:polyamine-modulated factor 1 isoform X3 n=1 Tax=Chionomys nivalis TaxID=269649 RepID=UPI00259171F2|nr:polyamine-modulated factor 1 isoform X3 [Chionomys nivalis]
MADVSHSNEAVEKGPEGFSPESVPVDRTISRVELLDTILDTFLQKLVTARSYERFTSCYKPFQQLDSKVMQWVYDKFVTQLQASIRQRDALCRQVQKQKAKNQDLADAVLAGRRQLEGLQQQIQALQQTWQALHREQRELLSVLRAPE